MYRGMWIYRDLNTHPNNGPQNSVQYDYNTMTRSCLECILSIYFVQDFQKQREEIERLRALLTQHNIPFDSKPGKSTQLSSLHSFNLYTACTVLSCVQYHLMFIYVTDEAKGTVSVTVKDQHLRGDNGLIDLQWEAPGASQSKSHPPFTSTWIGLSWSLWVTETLAGQYSCHWWQH